jgi:hypothetical protein
VRDFDSNISALGEGFNISKKHPSMLMSVVLAFRVVLVAITVTSTSAMNAYLGDVRRSIAIVLIIFVPSLKP